MSDQLPLRRKQVKKVTPLLIVSFAAILGFEFHFSVVQIQILSTLTGQTANEKHSDRAFITGKLRAYQTYIKDEIFLLARVIENLCIV